ncbi:hypothetical protein PybrP1_002782 [[Pythium] brassicae (nom. inval.)]|nr:hypothetical protein PybrP1_002782 [[Pythium] brassicae (nom. inval.)]
MTVRSNAVSPIQRRGSARRAVAPTRTTREGVIWAACAAKKSNKSTVGGGARRSLRARRGGRAVGEGHEARRFFAQDIACGSTHRGIVSRVGDDLLRNTKHEKAKSLYRLVRRLIARFGFSFRRPTRSALSYEQLISEQEAFVSTVGAAVAATYSDPSIFNADETGVYHDDSPTHIIAERGSRKSSKAKGGSSRATPGGSVEEGLSALPDGARYAVQTNGWMDRDFWQRHFIDCLWSDYVNSEFRESMALYVDNFKSHTASASVEALADLGTELIPLLANTTAVLQPLDVGVMGPFKQRLRATSQSAELSFLRERSHLPLRDRLLALALAPADAKRRAIAERVILAWQGVSADCITQAWSKSGLFKA